MHIIIDGNTHDKSCQLKLNNMDWYINCHVGFMQILVYNLVSLISFFLLFLLICLSSPNSIKNLKLKCRKELLTLSNIKYWTLENSSLEQLMNNLLKPWLKFVVASPRLKKNKKHQWSMWNPSLHFFFFLIFYFLLIMWMHEKDLVNEFRTSRDKTHVGFIRLRKHRP